MKSMKKTLSVLLALLLALICAMPGLAASDQALIAAGELHALGLLQGTGTGPDGNIEYNLDAPMTRAEAVTMLVRLLGAEEEAKAGQWSVPFSDVPEWAVPFVGYAYAQQLTNGIGTDAYGNPLFGSANTVTATEYLTLVLRSMGYVSGSDFRWDAAWEKTDALGLTHGEYNESSNASFLRGDMALVSLAAYRSGDTAASAAPAAPAEPSAPSAPVAPAAPAGGELSAVEISKKCSASVFYIEVTYRSGDGCTGSGFFISDDGLAVTNHHVIQNGVSFLIQTTDGRTYTDIQVIDFDADTDLALLRVNGIQTTGLTLSTRPLAQGERVYAIGSPFGFDNTMSEGIISTPSRDVGGISLIQFTAPIDHGSSGGALINVYGEVIGVTSSGIENTQAALNYAVPVALIADLDRSAQPLEVENLSSVALYPGLDSVIDFGALAGVEYTDYEAYEDAVYLYYDMSPYVTVYGADAINQIGAILDQYIQLLEGNGMDRRFNDDGTFYYGGGDEWVEWYFNSDSMVLQMRVGFFIPTYDELSDMPDFGAWFGVPVLEREELDNGLIVYGYDWQAYFTLSEYYAAVSAYMELIERLGFTFIEEDDYGLWYQLGDEIAVVSYDDDVLVIFLSP